MMNDARDIDSLIAQALDQVGPDGWIDIGNGAAGYEALRALRRKRGRATLDAATALTLSDDPRRRRLGAAILGGLSDVEPGLSPVFVEERFAALATLLRRCCAEAATPCLIEDAVYALGQLGDSRIVAEIAALRAHASPELRRAVAFTLGGLQAAQAVLIELSRDADMQVRNWATFGLGAQTEADGPALREALRARLNDPDPDTRVEAISGLARCRDADGLRALARAFPLDGATPLLEAAQALADPGLCDALARCAANGRPWPDHVETAWREAYDACRCALANGG